MHRALVTNKHLFRWGIKSSNACTFCETEKETYLHLFIECKYVQNLWNSVTSYMNSEYGYAESVSNAQKMFCNLASDNHVVNFLALLTLKYIYRQRCIKRPLSYRQLLTEVYAIRNIEKCIATKNGKVRKHNEKWFSIYEQN